jgi:hypothetical protein
MVQFIELKILSDEAETTTQLVNVSSIGRIYPNPQSNRKSIVELNYQSINDAPVFLEVEMPYDTLRSYVMS